MLHISFKNNTLLTIGLVLLCLTSMVFTLSIKAVFSYYNPGSQNLFFGPISPIFGYIGTPYIPSNSNTNSRSFSYNDYYAAYPYLQTQNYINSPSSNGSLANPVNNVANNNVRYLPTSNSYISGYFPSIYNSGAYNPYSTYQSINAYQSSNYSSLSSDIYQTVQTYPNNNNTNTQSQTSLPQAGTYGQSNTSAGNYIPAGQNGYYAPSQTQPYTNYSPYQTPNYPQGSTYSQNQPNVYIPSNSYTTNQTITTGYYNPNSDYWPTSQISTSMPTAEINGEYRGEWLSDTTSAAGQICFAEIEQFDTQIEGEIKLKEFTIGTNGKTNITGTVNGDTVSLEINLGGSVLIFEGTAQSNGRITGNYTVEGSSGSILDEGTLTLKYR